MNLPTPPSYDGSNRSWAELRTWAYHNCAGWQATHRTAEQQGLTEVEHLRRLACVLLSEVCERRNQQVQSDAIRHFSFVAPAAPAKIINGDDPFES